MSTGPTTDPALVILIISHTGDAHVPMVTRHLDRAGRPWAMLATDRLGADASLSFALEPAAGASAGPTGPRLALAGQRPVPLSEVTAVWNRRRVVGPQRDAGTGDLHRDQYIREQRLALLDGALAGLAARWVNAPLALEAARAKIDQLSRASALGLTVPATLVTDSADAVAAFAERHAATGVITKVISAGTPLVPDAAEQYVIFTQRLAQLPSAAQISAAPAIYQAEVAKAWEVRAVVVGSEVLCCKIDSQASPRTELDWRHYDFDRVAHEPVEPPAEVAVRLVALCRHYGLVYGAIDLAVTPAGDWVFFELNPNGQWGWLEEKAGLPIGRSLARELAA